ncbi:coiled-coil domain-containing protein 167 isoform X1 [Pygocentrus nattereri]|uniref:coiled-coil domain-containing protein 167 isoform X1 n=1 Tax=Pygocentrus nattereri TaxID=42514 RepID=UPI001890CCB1|nr:coiled-coil domain-containing protein 167 isoform X1 [Pygocentrus nattereri]
MPKEKKEKEKERKERRSVADEIDRIEEQRSRCQSSLERAEFRHRREQLLDEDRQALEDEMTIMNERIQKYGAGGAARREQEEYVAVRSALGHQCSVLLCLYLLRTPAQHQSLDPL